MLTADPRSLPIECPPRPPVPRPSPPPAELPLVRAGTPAVPVVEVDHPRIRPLGAYVRAGWSSTTPACLLRAPVAELLCAAASSLPADFGLAVFDGYRSRRLQAELHDHYYADGTLPPGYISPPSADPERPAPHQTGGAVDVTLMWRLQPLALGTDFDDMTDAAHPCAFEGGPGLVRDLRRLLHHTMVDHDFEPHHLEWWHFEHGTRSWAHARGVAPLFGAIGDAEAPDVTERGRPPA